MTDGASKTGPRLRILGHPAHVGRDYSPYTHLLYREMEALGHRVEDFGLARTLRSAYDVYHLHWPDSLVDNNASATKAAAKAAALVLMVEAQRRRGARIVWTAHNELSHHRRFPRIETWLWQRLMPRLDGVIYLTEASRERILVRKPGLADVPYAVIPHGHYRGWYPSGCDRATARREIGVPDDAEVLLFFGSIGSHKNVDALIEAFRAWDRPTARLVLAGAVDPMEREAPYGRALRAAVASDPRIVPRLEMVPAEGIQTIMAAADLFVQPSTRMLNSGTALVALSFDRPVLMHEGAACRDLERLVGSDWVRGFTAPLTPEALDEACRWALAPRAVTAPLEALEWPVLAARTIAFYERLRADRPLATPAGLRTAS